MKFVKWINDFDIRSSIYVDISTRENIRCWLRIILIVMITPLLSLVFDFRSLIECFPNSNLSINN